MKAAAALLLSLVLAGCQATPKAPPLDPLKARMPADIRQLCDAVPAAPDRGSSMGDLYTYLDGFIGQYAECALRDRAKLRWVESQGM